MIEKRWRELRKEREMKRFRMTGKNWKRIEGKGEDGRGRERTEEREEEWRTEED